MKAIYPDLKDKRVLVTGCASGIGASQCRLFLEQGCEVYGIDLHVANIEHARFHFIQLDLMQATDVKVTLEPLARMDIICNTAGILDDYQPSLATDEQLWNQVLNTNLRSMYLVCNIFIAKSLAAQRPLTIVNMASIASFMASGGGAAYTASKHAIVGYTKQLNFDYGKFKIRANCLAPGAVQTQMTQEDFNTNTDTARKVARQTLIGRYAQPEEIAQATLFLASAVSEYIYGAVLPIDGGFSLGKEI
ncbi:MAG: 3-oxoacyl-ACP reductase [Lactobacillus sp.]|uniref:3-oxoacyl-ACP reductase n=1 Tax=Bombilactobacillus bombi TaxID=1303590 RepID=UPI0035E83108|nr:3-oxoacyl-ACP reductase [Lactobacillus sp.]